MGGVCSGVLKCLSAFKTLLHGVVLLLLLLLLLCYSGRLIRRVSTGYVTHTLAVSKSGRFVLTASVREVTIRWTHSLRVFQVRSPADLH